MVVQIKQGLLAQI